MSDAGRAPRGVLGEQSLIVVRRLINGWSASSGTGLTGGFAASSSAAEFVRIWRAMITLRALEHPAQHPAGPVSCELDDRGFSNCSASTSRWNAIVRGSRTMRKSSARSKISWNARLSVRPGCPRSSTNSDAAAVQPGAETAFASCPPLDILRREKLRHLRLEVWFGGKCVSNFSTPAGSGRIERISRDESLRASFPTVLTISVSPQEYA